MNIADCGLRIGLDCGFNSAIDPQSTIESAILNPRSAIDVCLSPLAGGAEGARAGEVAIRLDAGRHVAKCLGTDAIEVVLLNTAPISLAGRILTSRRVIVDRKPFVRHRYGSLTTRLFPDFRIREHRLLARRFPRG